MKTIDSEKLIEAMLESYRKNTARYFPESAKDEMMIIIQSQPEVKGEGVSEGVIGNENPYPLKDVLIILRNAAIYLLDKKDYDAHDHEEILLCVKQANEIINHLKQQRHE